jgi:predicted MFS family arabinose efflux permease
VFSAVLVAAMACASMPSAVVSALAPELRSDLDIDSRHIGVFVAVITLIGAAVSPVVGRWTDRVGARRALLAVFVTAAAAFVVSAMAPGFAVLLVGGLLAAVATSAANPATNKSIVANLPRGRRATMTGLKQSGVPVGTVVGGAVAPPIAAVLGWRVALTVVAVVILAFAVAAVWTMPPDISVGTATRAATSSPRRHEIVLAIYVGLIGLTNASLLFVPLYAVESLDVGSGLGGATLAIAGVAAVAGRLVWPGYVERTGRYRAALIGVATLGAIAYGFILRADGWGGLPVLACAAALAGATTSSASALVMLAVMQGAGDARAGTASGTVMVGFLLGFGVGAPLHGWLAGGSAGYTAVWWLAVSGAALAAAVATVTTRATPT